MVKQSKRSCFLISCLVVAFFTILLPVTQKENTVELVTMVSDERTSTHFSVEPNHSELQLMFPLTIGDSPYVINNRQICKGVKSYSFLVLVHTATGHFMRRNSIRETWANVSLYRKYQMRIVFLLGLPKNESLQAKLEEESYLHGDLVQGNFLDTYHNLTHKGVMGLRWVTENCRQAKFIVKVDDDVFVNTLLLIKNVLLKYWNSSRMIIGPIIYSAKVRHSGKWAVEEGDFQGMTRYPFPYSGGEFVVLTKDIIEQLYKAAKMTPFFWIDDIYLFGLLPNKVGNIRLVRPGGVNKNETEAVECYSSTKKKCPLVAAYAYSDGVMSKLWQWALRQNKKYINHT